MSSGDLGFRVFKLDRSNIRSWDPDADDLAETLLAHEEHLVPGRGEQDILYEILLKLGLDLCVTVQRKSIVGKNVFFVASGLLVICLDQRITQEEAEPLALGIAESLRVMAPVGERLCVFRDSGFADDVAKSNVAAILQQHGIEAVRSLELALGHGLIPCDP
jgi:adenine-specific DNA-methyltransferase